MLPIESIIPAIVIPVAVAVVGLAGIKIIKEKL